MLATVRTANHLYATYDARRFALPPSPRRRSRRKAASWAFLAFFLLPVFGALAHSPISGGPTHWSQWDRSGHQPNAGAAAAHPEARILVMSGRTRGWKGALAVHSWIVIKRENDRTWSRYDVAGWGKPVRLNWWPPDLWFGERGDVLVDIKGAQAEALIPRIEAAIKELSIRQ